MAEYATKFKSLACYYLHYQREAGERSKYVKFLNVLRPEINMAVNYQEVTNFVQLTNMCRVYDRDQRAKTTFYKSANVEFVNERK